MTITVISLDKTIADIGNFDELPQQVRTKIRMADTIWSEGFQSILGSRNRVLQFSLGGYWKHGRSGLQPYRPNTGQFVCTSYGSRRWQWDGCFLRRTARVVETQPVGPQGVFMTDTIKSKNGTSGVELFLEILDNVETIGGVTEEYGVHTVEDLVYLISLLGKEPVEAPLMEQSHGSRIIEFLGILPNGSKYLKYVSAEEMSAASYGGTA
jgi:hypothetical protein